MLSRLFARPVALAALAAASFAAGCGHASWPNEPGVPMELARSENMAAGDLFWSALVNRRRAAGLAEPMLALRYQEEIRALAEDVQAGKTSVGDAERAVDAWARHAYQRDVTTYAIDCAAGAGLSVPSALVDTPFVAMAYAAVHFQPRSSGGTRCVILTAAVSGSEAVAAFSL